MLTKYGPQNRSCESVDRNRNKRTLFSVCTYLVFLSNLENPFFSLTLSLFLSLSVPFNISLKNSLQKWGKIVYGICRFLFTFLFINRPLLTSSFQVFLFLEKLFLDDCSEVFLFLFYFFLTTTPFAGRERKKGSNFSWTFFNVYVIQSLNFTKYVNSFRSLT